MKVMPIIFTAMVLAVMLSCEKAEESPAVKPGQASSVMDLAVTTGQFPPSGYDELTSEEFRAWLGPMETIAKLLEEADYPLVIPLRGTFERKIALTVEGLKTFPGIDDALRRGGLIWTVFRVRTYRVMAAATAVRAEQRRVELEAEEPTPQRDAALAEIEKNEVFLARVPAANRQLVSAQEVTMQTLGLLERP